MAKKIKMQFKKVKMYYFLLLVNKNYLAYNFEQQQPKNLMKILIFRKVIRKKDNVKWRRTKNGGKKAITLKKRNFFNFGNVESLRIFF